MARTTLRAAALAAALSAFAFPVPALDMGVVSTMRNVNAVMEARGFFLAPANDMSGKIFDGDLAPSQAFEIMRPGMSRVSIGRLYTSCSCVQLHSPKRNFAQGERAVLELRNVRATPPAGQIYAVYVQITSPIRTTLRFDTFVQSSQFVTPPPRLAATAAEVAEEDPFAAETEAETVAEATAVAETIAEEEAEAAAAAEPAGAAAEPVIEEPVPAAEPDGGIPVRIEPRLSLVTLGVKDMGRSVAFYEKLGWEPVDRGKYDAIVFFQLNGMALALYPLQDLLRDQNLGDREAVAGGVTLAVNVRDKEEVRAYYDAFVKAGGTSLREPEETAWGSTTAYVADPDGYGWEISWVPQFILSDDGGLWIK